MLIIGLILVVVGISGLTWTIANKVLDEGEEDNEL